MSIKTQIRIFSNPGTGSISLLPLQLKPFEGKLEGRWSLEERLKRAEEVK